MARKTKSEAAHTRNAILDAAEAEMQASGVTGASFERIARRAAVTRGAIYWHFRDKDALLSAMLARTLPPLRDLQDSLHAKFPGRPAPALLREMLLHGLGRLASDPHHRRICHIIAHCCENTSPASPVGEIMRASFTDARSVIRSLCHAADAHRQLQSNIDADAAGDMIIAFMSGVYDCALRYPDLYPVDRDWAPLVDALLAGLFEQPRD